MSFKDNTPFLSELPTSPVNMGAAASVQLKKTCHTLMSFCVVLSLRLKERPSSLQNLWDLSKSVDLLETVQEVIAIHFYTQKEESGVSQRHVQKV